MRRQFGQEGFDLLRKLRLTVPMYAYSRSLLASLASLPAWARKLELPESQYHLYKYGYLYKKIGKTPGTYFKMLKLRCSY